MLIVEGMPGSACTRRLGAVLARAPQATVFPALPSPSGHGGETVVRVELAEDYRRSEIAEHLPGPVLADGCHLGTLARAYVRARLCLEWDTFRRALGMTAPLEARHRDDEVLILHSSPETAFRRRHGPTARPGGEFAALRAYAQFFDALDQWVTPGPKGAMSMPRTRPWTSFWRPECPSGHRRHWRAARPTWYAATPGADARVRWYWPAAMPGSSCSRGPCTCTGPERRGAACAARTM